MASNDKDGSDTAPLDDVIRSINEGDQLQASWAAVAGLLREHFTGLMDKGFTRAEALHLTAQLQASLFTQGRKG